MFNKNIVHRDATLLSKIMRTCPLSGMPHGSLVHAQIERSCEIVNGLSSFFVASLTMVHFQDTLMLITELPK